MSKRRLARRRLASLRREKTVLLAVAVQLAIAAFSSFLFVGLVALYAPGGAGIVVDVGVAGNASETLAPAVTDDESRTVRRYPNRSAALEAFQNREVDAVLIGTMGPDGTISVEAVAPAGDFRTTVVVVQIRDALATLERTLRRAYADRLVREPVPMPPEAGGSPFYGFAYTVLVPLLAVLPGFISGSIAVDSLTEELERGTMALLRVAPVTVGDVVDGTAITAVGIAPLQAIAWIALLAANGTTVAHPIAIILVVTLLAAVFVAVGTGLATSLADRRAAQLLYSGGSLSLLAGTTVLPEGPVNAIAKLAIGSTTWATWLFVGALAVVAIIGHFGARRLATRAIEGR